MEQVKDWSHIPEAVRTSKSSAWLVPFFMSDTPGNKRATMVLAYSTKGQLEAVFTRYAGKTDKEVVEDKEIPLCD